MQHVLNNSVPKSNQHLPTPAARAITKRRAILHSSVITLDRLEPRTLLAVGDPYAFPNSPRVEIDLNAGWRFRYDQQLWQNPQLPSTNDTTWAQVNVPHTWGNSGAFLPRDGWYRRSIQIDPSLAGKRLYLEFEGVTSVTQIYINGVAIDHNPTTPAVDPHFGAYARFAYDVTAQLTPGTHLLAVGVTPYPPANTPPHFGGDYIKQGGIYRDVKLVAVDPIHVARLRPAPDTNVPIAADFAFFDASNISTSSADVRVRTHLDNDSNAPRNLIVTSRLIDSAGITRFESSNPLTLNPLTSLELTQTGSVANPRLWNGLIDPYLYDLSVEVRDASTNALLDLARDRVGIRSFKINAQPNPAHPDPTQRAAFILNDQPYRVVGANVHQDHTPAVGWAASDAQLRSDLDLVLELGATSFRTAHYQHNEATYDYADQVGLLVYTELSINSYGSNDPAFIAGAKNQLAEMIWQNYNSPGVWTWSLYNEIPASSFPGIQQLDAYANALDPTRPTSGDTFGENMGPLEQATDIIGHHLYNGWYGGQPQALVDRLRIIRNKLPTLPMGLTEFGGGASLYHFADPVIFSAPDPNNQRFHAQNTLAKLHEIIWTDVSAENYIHSVYIWQMFDMLTGRLEGDTDFINDKGLITRDRQRKDAFYFYAAAWNDPTRSYANRPILHLADKGWTHRNNPAAEVTVYSNIGTPTFRLNDGPPTAMIPKTVGTRNIINTFTLPSNINLSIGTNIINISASDGINTLTDSAVWNHRQNPDGPIHTRIDFTTNTNNVQSDYLADTGLPFNGISGWINRNTGLPLDNSANAFLRSTSAAPFNELRMQSGIMMPPTAAWELAVPNGLYDVHLVAGDSLAVGNTTPGKTMVNNLAIEGYQVFDTDASTTDNGRDAFTARVRITDGKLTLTTGLGGWLPRLAYLDLHAIDNTPPTLAGSTVEFETRQSITLSFSEPVDPNLLASSLIITHQTTSSPLDPTQYNINYNPETLSALITFNTPTPAGLPNGDYRVFIPSDHIRDEIGLFASSNIDLSFHILGGDANRDRRVDFSDLLALARNYNQSGKTFSQGNFDYSPDGLVGFSDLLILARNYNGNLPADFARAIASLNAPTRSNTIVNRSTLKTESGPFNSSTNFFAATSVISQVKSSTQANDDNILA